MQQTDVQPDPMFELAPIENEPSNSQELAPLNIIRSETVLSKLPIHNLSKKGRVDIEIVKKNDRGEVELKWEISYSEKYGQARQIAYKLDTIIVNQKIDESGRPIPRIIKLGSLRNIGKELGIPANTQSIKNALFQNAFTAITAKLKYKSNDGTERTLEAGFTRYSVVFAGEKLPDGRKADAVYIVLNEPYLEVLNNAPVRPLNYNYLKSLPPSAQRFYEIISYRIFAAFKYKHPQAKLVYSEYCTYSAQQRYFDFDRVKKQMYKVHVPHIKSGYISKVSYERTTDDEGREDWLMLYVPGPKAQAEYRAFNRGGLQKMMDAVAVPKKTRTPKQPKSTAEQGSDLLPFTPSPAPSVETSTQPDPVAIELVQFFHQVFHLRENFQPHSSEIEKAAELLARNGDEKARFIVSYAITQARQTNFQMQHFGAILKVYEQAGQHEFEKDKSFREEQARKRAQAAAEAAETYRRQELEQAYTAYCIQQVEEHLAHQHPTGTLEILVAARKDELRRLDSTRYQFWMEDVFTSFVTRQIYREIADTLSDLLSFDDFYDQHREEGIPSFTPANF